MNVFTFGTIAAPAAGVLAAIDAASGHVGTVVVASALGGLLLGALVHPGVTIVAARAALPKQQIAEAPPQGVSPRDWIAGTSVVLFAIASPFVAWFVAWVVVSGVVRFAG